MKSKISGYSNPGRNVARYRCIKPIPSFAASSLIRVPAENLSTVLGNAEPVNTSTSAMLITRYRVMSKTPSWSASDHDTLGAGHGSFKENGKVDGLDRS